METSEIKKLTHVHLSNINIQHTDTPLTNSSDKNDEIKGLLQDGVELKTAQLTKKLSELELKKENSFISIETTYKMKKVEKQLKHLEEGKDSFADLLKLLRNTHVTPEENKRVLKKGQILEIGINAHEKIEDLDQKSCGTAQSIWKHRAEFFASMLSQIPEVELNLSQYRKKPTIESYEYNNYGLSEDAHITFKQKDDKIFAQVDGKEYTLSPTMAQISGGQLFPNKTSAINCDAQASCIDMYGNVCIAFADGCGWGKESKDSSTLATTKAVKRLSEYISKHKTATLSSIARESLDAFLEIQELHEKDQKLGTTTLITCVIVDGYAVVTHVGDSSLFLIRKGEKLIEVTTEARENSINAQDPGGRLGRYIQLDDDLEMKDLKADFRNIGIKIIKLKAGDILFTTSDGRVDCYDPEFLGFKPSDFKDKGEKWSSNSKHHRIRREFIQNKLHDQLHSLHTIQQMEKAVIDYITATTLPTKLFLVTNPDKALPTEHNQYKGKVDHANAVWYEFKG